MSYSSAAHLPRVGDWVYCPRSGVSGVVWDADVLDDWQYAGTYTRFRLDTYADGGSSKPYYFCIAHNADPELVAESVRIIEAPKFGLFETVEVVDGGAIQRGSVLSFEYKRRREGGFAWHYRIRLFHGKGYVFRYEPSIMSASPLDRAGVVQ